MCDNFLSVLATAENMVKDNNKKYGHYDEFNSSKYKTDNDLSFTIFKVVKNFQRK